ncbi:MULTISPECIES: hypothetical protein [Mycobacterium]|uniref:Uncharacterized protein n=3 Tax=Mycobacterium TaxID=1763 RepID=A0AA37V178_9MYCO|nr:MULTISPECIES: hypothetical protein [Mycobacterium]MBZ4631367.1 hypothetical protein [Mycobacterium avium subsp. hominissuis]ORW04856.1 hypothetical protein AWC14_02345 [Mycobacterium kyorinense]PBJ41604.1 hypothetical protein XV03_00055 [Mycobacterium avium subsp. hominissuis]PBJ66993.1 hypothetical protein BB737_04595 [Mycobacterium avium subsp. hominissuis]QWY65417.1 hypothetical protein BJP78_27540 [Mycobacterium avium subsp. hominissuis]
MILQWRTFEGPGGERADGTAGIYLTLHTGKLVQLYFMDPDEPLCPINRERARLYKEFATVDEAHRYAQYDDDMRRLRP